MDKHLPNQAETNIYHTGKVGTDNDLFKIQSLKIVDIYELNMYLVALFMYSYVSSNLAKYLNNCFT